MLFLPVELTRHYGLQLDNHGIADHRRPHFLKWLRYYWDFCHKYGYAPNDRASLSPFEEKLRSKHQKDFQCEQARQAISPYYATLAQAFPGERAVAVRPLDQPGRRTEPNIAPAGGYRHNRRDVAASRMRSSSEPPISTGVLPRPLMQAISYLARQHGKFTDKPPKSKEEQIVNG